ncbi:MAG: diaminopimelate decarboxylase [Halieaceae bacterium]|nr:diaminopimelate decarboxylase [Halieaceae bacterium]
MRVNPDVDAGTHPYVSTGLRENKFGVDIETARRLYQLAHEHRALEPVAIDCHIGSQILDIAPFLESLDCLLALVDDLAVEGITLRHLDIGGGLGVSYQESAPAIEEYMSALTAKLGSRDLELVLEPGRSIVALAGTLLTRVLYLKPSDAKNFAVVDAAMNDLLRPSLYDAWQDIQAVTPHEGESRHWDIVGPICETGDFLGKDRRLALSEGDLLAAMGAGAYGFAMASNYNTRPRAAEVMVSGESLHLVGQREALSDLWQRERIPEGPTS